MIADRRPTILVVDDTPENLKLMNGLLRDDYQVKVANGAEKALAIVQSEAPPDLILLDIMMPGIDGYEVCRRLKQDDLTRDIPIIFLTAMADEENEEHGLKLGAVDYITKPISPPILLARVATQIALQDALRQARESNRRAEELLHCVLPTVAADEIRATGTVLARRHDDVAVLFCDVVEFTSYCDSHQPEEVVRRLDALFGLFEQEAGRHGLEKIKTIGDAFMASAGLLQAVEDPLATAISCGLKLASMVDDGWKLRVGVHFGPVVAGIVGQSRFQFDIWGDTVNVAARMTGAGQPGTVAVTEETWLKIADRFEGRSLGQMPVKGKGSINVVEISAAK